MGKMSAKIQAAVMAIVLAFGVAVPALAMDTPGANVGTKNAGMYTAHSNKTLELHTLTAKAKKAKKVTIGSKIKYSNGTYKVVSVAKNAFKGAKATQVTLPSTIKKIKSGAFNGAKAKKLTVTIKSRSLTKKAVKGCFKGAKATKITVKVPKSKLKAYKKYFTKKNTGAKKTIVVKAY